MTLEQSTEGAAAPLPEPLAEDLSALVARLVRALRKAAPQHDLPALPGPLLTIAGEGEPDRGHWYTADQMREYARAALSAAQPAQDN